MAPTATAEDVAVMVEEYVKSNEIMIFSKSYCPFCNKVKKLFDDNGLAFKSLELDQMGQLGADIQASLLQTTGQKTVPSVFFSGKHIGKEQQ